MLYVKVCEYGCVLKTKQQWIYSNKLTTINLELAFNISNIIMLNLNVINVNNGMHKLTAFEICY